jgi:hypothetical protein
MSGALAIKTKVAVHRYSVPKIESASDKAAASVNTTEIGTRLVAVTAMERAHALVGGEETFKTDMPVPVRTRIDCESESSEADTDTNGRANCVSSTIWVPSISRSDSLSSDRTLTPTSLLTHYQPIILSPSPPPPVCPATTTPAQSPLSLTRRLCICTFNLLGLLTATVFGVWAIKSYNVSVEALQIAREANQIGLLGFCASELEASSGDNFANRRFGKGCEEVLRAFKGLGFEEVVRGAGLAGEGNSELATKDTLQMQVSLTPNSPSGKTTTTFCHGRSEDSSGPSSTAATTKTASLALASSIPSLSQPSQPQTTTVLPVRNLTASPHLYTLSSRTLEKYSRSTTTLPPSPNPSHQSPPTTMTEIVPARNVTASPHRYSLSSRTLEEYSRSTTTLPPSPAVSHHRPTNTFVHHAFAPVDVSPPSVGVGVKVETHVWVQPLAGCCLGGVFVIIFTISLLFAFVRVRKRSWESTSNGRIQKLGCFGGDLESQIGLGSYGAFPSLDWKDKGRDKCEVLDQ